MDGGIVASGAVVTIDGVVSNATVLWGGVLSLTANAIATGVTVSAGGLLTGAGEIDGDNSVAGVVSGLSQGGNYGDTLEIVAGGQAEAVTVLSTTFLLVDSGAVAGASIYGSGFIEPGATVSGAVVNSGGDLSIFAGATASGVTVSSGGEVDFEAVISSGVTWSAVGVVSSTAVLDGVTVLSGGDLYLSGATVFSGATLQLSSGVLVTDITVSQGGVLTGSGVIDGTNYVYGVISNVVVGAPYESTALELTGFAGGVTIQNATFDVASGATASGTILAGLSFADGGVYDGEIMLVSGTALDTDVEFAGKEYVVSGAVASGGVIQDGGYVYVDGLLSDVVISSGGSASIQADGSISGAVVDSGGVLYVVLGASIANVTVSSGGEADFGDVRSGEVLSIPGLVSQTTVLDGVTALSGAILDFNPYHTVQSGGTLQLQSGAAAFGVDELAGGLVTGPGALGDNQNQAAGVVSGVSLGDYGGLDLLSGGDAEALTLAGAILIVEAGASASATSLTSGFYNSGIIQVYGSAAGTIVSAGGIDQVYAGGVDVGAMVLPGGELEVMSGGVASAATVGSGGVVVLSSGGVLAGLTLDSGGVIDLAGTSVTSAAYDGATLTLTEAGGGALALSVAVDSASAGDVPVVTADGQGGSDIQFAPPPVAVSVVASPNPAPATGHTTQDVEGRYTVVRTYDASGALVNVAKTHAEGANLVTIDYDATGAQTASTIVQNPGGGEVITQQFGSAWNQLSATIVVSSGGTVETQTFDSAWDQLTASLDYTVSGVAIHQDFTPGWVMKDATTTTDLGGGVTDIQHFDGNWNQTSATLIRDEGGGTVLTQDFDANWVQTDATYVTHPSANVTQTQYFAGATFADMIGAEIVTSNQGATYDQMFDANWAMTSATITDVPDANGVIKVFTTDGAWTILTETDTAADGSKTYFDYVQPGGETLTAAADHSTTFVFQPGDVGGDVINGLHTLNLGGPIHDVLDFEGFGAGAAMTQLDATHWQITAPGHAAETFTLGGGAVLAAGDFILR
jgi:autotransporter passenger strand-loop-strand repeat protein